MVTLSKATRRFKLIKCFPIPENGSTTMRNTVYNKFNPLIIKSKTDKNFFKEIPVNYIISFFQVKFSNNTSNFPFFILQSTNDLLDSYHVIFGLTSRHKTSLTKSHNFIKERSKPIYNNFGDNFIANIT